MTQLITEQLGLLEADGPLVDYLDRAQEAGVNAHRLFYLFNFGRENPMCPFKKVGEWTAGGRGVFPHYEMLQENPAYWDLFDRFHYGCKERGMGVHGVLEDRCSRDYQNDRFYDPFWSSVQKYPDPNDKKNKAILGGICGEQMKPWHVHWFKKVVDRLNKIGVGYTLEVENEYRNFPEGPKGYSQEVLFQWMRWAISTLVGLGVPKNRIVVSILDGKQWQKYYGLGTLFSYHGVVTQKRAAERIDELILKGPATPDRIILSGDGGRDGSGDPDPNPAKGWKGLGEADAPGLALLLKRFNVHTYGYMPRASKPIRGLLKKGGKPENLDKANFKPAKLMSDVFHPKEDETLPLPPEPEPEPGPVVEPDEPIKEVKMNIFQWLFGKNSQWQKRPLTARFFLGLLMGLILGLIL